MSCSLAHPGHDHEQWKSEQRRKAWHALMDDVERREALRDSEEDEP
jgi:hypothetical protein